MFNPNCALAYIKFYVELGFESKDQFKHDMTNHVSLNIFDVLWKRSIDSIVETICFSTCKLKIHAT